MPISEAVKKFMRVPKGAGNSVPWDPELTPYIIEPMNCLASREYDAVIFVGPARTGKTIGLIDGWIVYTIVCDPSDMLVVQMTEDKAREHSKKRLDRTFRSSAAVKKRMSPRRNDNNVHDKTFRDGSFLKIGWPSVNIMSSSDYRFVALTDYDRFPENIDSEGDGFSLASKRTTTFMSAGMTLVESSPGRDICDSKWRRKSPHEAPPTTGILSLYNRGDRRRWYWPCPHCGEYFQPAMDAMTGYRNEPDPFKASEAAYLLCPHCSGIITAEKKRELNSAGVWLREGQVIDRNGNVSGEPRRSRIASFWMEGPAAAYQTWAQLVYKLLTAEQEYEATGSEETLRAVTRLLLQYSQQQVQVEGQIAAARQSAGIATERMTEAHKQLLALQQRISDLDGKKLTADEKSVLARKDELIQALTLLDVKQQELQKQTALNELKKKTIQLTSQLAEEERAQRQQHDLDIATVGMGDQQRQRYQVQLSLRQKYQQQLEQLRRDSEQKGTYNTDDYRKAEQALTESLNRQLNENRRYWQQLEVVQGNWKNGVLRAFQNFTVDADNTAGTAEQVFSSAFSNMGNGLATFVTTGKLNFKSFTSSVLSDMAKILAQATMMKSIKGIGSVLGFDLSSLSLNANGGIYQSADLSRYSGTVVNRPTFFAFAKGAGVMGEAGPEAILPLRRGADGKLGVVADIGGSGMAMFAPQYNIEINNDGTNGQIGPAALKVVYDLGKKAAADFMQQQTRDGGRLSGAYR
ncbi:phage tail tape measure protein [Escherichia coli]|nr:phage tail tape measure protein [Escherichia coli]EJA7658593.1 phage tail tape measure protein [Escherichia coli]EMC0947129.1 phage tail tape measure protein [Escherichia coli]MBF8824695.1 phage tail tape measure protein [Escherichia coli]